MRIPDETKYKENEKRLEDTPGWVMCTQCDKCTITRLNQIYSDGAFFCFFRKAWKRGDDLLEFKCRGFRMKHCSSCKMFYKCKERRDGISYCNRYRSRSIYHPRRFYYGSIFPIRTDDPVVVAREENYLRKKQEEFNNNDGTIAIGTFNP